MAVNHRRTRRRRRRSSVMSVGIVERAVYRTSSPTSIGACGPSGSRPNCEKLRAISSRRRDSTPAPRPFPPAPAAASAVAPQSLDGEANWRQRILQLVRDLSSAILAASPRAPPRSRARGRAPARATCRACAVAGPRTPARHDAAAPSGSGCAPTDALRPADELL